MLYYFLAACLVVGNQPRWHEVDKSTGIDFYSGLVEIQIINNQED